MNFFDSYDVTRTNTPPPAAQQSLNEEVSEVVGQLRGFWGGFRKQSLSVLDTARKDLSSVVSQAQQELSKLTVSEETPALSSEEQEASVASSETSDVKERPEAGPSSTSSEDASASTSAEGTTSPSRPTHTRSASQPFQFLSRLQSSIPPNLLETVQKNIPEQLKTAPASVDFTQIRSTLTTEFQRVQGLTRAQAEEYVHKSEELLREVAKEAGEFLKDAVKVVPPEEVKNGGTGVVWDGSDVWMLPEMGANEGAKGKGKERQISGRASSETLRAVATRAESMLKMLRRDPSVVRMDPEGEERIRELYAGWVKEKLEATEGGIEGEEWKSKKEKELSDEVDGGALQETRGALVPSEMTEETFWTRYFFRVYQIKREEEMRRTLLMGSTQNEEDFSWEDDDDEPAKRETLLGKPQPNEKKLGEALSAPISPAGTHGNTSPRVSSEDSFDVVSSNVSTSGEAPPKEAPVEQKGDEEDGDSDWE